MQILATGLIAELLVHQHQRDKPYVIRRSTRGPAQVQPAGEVLDVVEPPGQPAVGGR